MAKSYRIGVIGGDGTGPEVIREGRKVLIVAAQKYGFGIEWVDYDLGGSATKGRAKYCRTAYWLN